MARGVLGPVGNFKDTGNKAMSGRGWSFKAVAAGIFLLAFWSFGGLGLAGQGAGTQSQPGAAAQGQAEYVIGMGDVLKIMVWKEPDLTCELAVRSDGRISLPLVGDVQAAGQTIGGLKKTLEQRYGKLITDPAVSVMLTQSKSRRYYIIGQIKQPGEFPIDFPITVLQALAKSGGFLDWAKKDKITIVRRGENGQESILPFDYEALVAGHNQQQNVLVQPGDTIVVP